MQSPGISTTVTEALLRCQGHPMRISLFDPVYHDRLGRYPGILTEVLHDGLVVECVNPPPSLPPETSVTLELLSGHELLWCHTRLKEWKNYEPARLKLEWPESLQTQQRRASPRIDTHLPIHYFTMNSTTPLPGVIIDVSLGGAALKGNALLQVGQVVSLVFELGSGFSFQEIQAEVVRVSNARSSEFVSGMRFVGLTQEQQSNLAAWVRSRCGREA